jgi:hypothetical protein
MSQFEVPAKHWGDKEIAMLMANQALLDEDTKRELGLVADEAADEGEDETDEDVIEDDSDLVSVKVVGEIPSFDEDMNHTHNLEVGSVVEVPQELADGWVEAGLAEPVNTEGE